jgi:outer membrane protein insertion porin family
MIFIKLFFLFFLTHTYSSEIRRSDLADFFERYGDNKNRETLLKSLGQFLPHESVKLEDNKDLLIKKRKKMSSFKIRFLRSRKVSNELNDLVNIRAGSYFNESAIKSQFDELDEFLKEKGYIDNTFELVQKNDTGSEVDVQVIVKNQSYFRIREVIEKFDRPDSEVSSLLKKLIGLGFSRSSLNVFIDGLYQDLYFLGYFQAKITLTPQMIEDHTSKENQKYPHTNAVDIIAQIELGQKLAFSFSGNTSLDSEKLKDYLKISLPKSQSAVNKDVIKQMIKDYYLEYGFYQTVVEIDEYGYGDSRGRLFKNFFIKITENSRKKLKKVNFLGNRLVSNEELDDLFFDDGTPLIQAGFYDAKYFERALKVIKEFYHKKGFIFVDVKKQVREDLAEVDYIIRENGQILIKEINLYDNGELVTSHDINKIKIVNQIGKPLNVVSVEQDINTVLASFKEKGYFFSEIERRLPGEVVQIDEIKNTAVLNFYLNRKEIFYLGDIFVFGPDMTDEIVIRRELEPSRGALLTQDILQDFEARLRSLNLFGHLKLEYFSKKNGDKNYLDIVILADEKSFGSLQFAPGYRTGRGVKLDMGITYNNIWRRNHQASLRTELNQRLDFDQTYYKDNARSGKLLEYSIQALYTVPYIGAYPLRTDFSTSLTRRKFARFDADVETAKIQAGKSFGRHFTLSVNYQLESIRQFNASQTKDFGSFRIGSLTPSLAADFRDSTSAPRSGFYSAFSYERASPWLLSMDNDNLKVDFYSIISRNYFYVPIKNMVLAHYLSFGIQKNLANERSLVNAGTSNVVNTRGYIPTIKVFRLAGEDIIRGFDDDESNRVFSKKLSENNEDIADLIVSDRAYFFNFKIEPRFRFGDDFIVAPFYDMGRVFINNFVFSRLRSAVGMSFKYITPVGTLDFDYGVKLKRRTKDGSRDTVGRFHLNIGTF